MDLRGTTSVGRSTRRLPPPSAPREPPAPACGPTPIPCRPGAGAATTRLAPRRVGPLRLGMRREGSGVSVAGPVGARTRSPDSAARSSSGLRRVGGPGSHRDAHELRDRRPQASRAGCSAGPATGARRGGREPDAVNRLPGTAAGGGCTRSCPPRPRCPGPVASPPAGRRTADGCDAWCRRPSASRPADPARRPFPPTPIKRRDACPRGRGRRRPSSGTRPAS